MFTFFRANQTIGDLNRLNEKYRNDVKKMKSLERTLEITIVDEKNELLRFDKASQDKDACIRVIQSNINNFETEISALRLKEERQKNVMESLIRTDAPLGEIINDVSNLISGRALTVVTVKIRAHSYVCVLQCVDRNTV